MPITSKGADTVAVANAVAFVKGSGCPIVIVQGDPEHGIGTVLQMVCQQLKQLGVHCTERRTVKGAHSSNGGVERHISIMSAQTRAVLYQFEARTGIQLKAHSELIAWMVRHASFLLYHVGCNSSGVSPYFTKHGYAYRGVLVEFGERVLCHVGEGERVSSLPKLNPRWTEGFYLGTSTVSDGKVCAVLDKSGLLVIKTFRTIKRLPVTEAWGDLSTEVDFFDSNTDGAEQSLS